MTEAERKALLIRRKKERISLHVRTIRKSLGITVEELSSKCGYETKSGLIAIENGSRLPGESKGSITDKTIANALNISLDQLWGRKRMTLSDKGYAKLSDSERTAVCLLAPMLKAMSPEGRDHLINEALLILKAENATPKWEQTEHQKEKTSFNKS